jgi:hypothetical protein
LLLLLLLLLLHMELCTADCSRSTEYICIIIVHHGESVFPRSNAEYIFVYLLVLWDNVRHTISTI